MYFVVGLGNPGGKYAGTRHNVGFEVVDALAKRSGFLASKQQLGAEVSRGHIADKDALLIKPQTYMNLSGDAVGALLRYYKGQVSDVIVIHDELDFDLGEVRLKISGGHAGHNGLKSLMAHIGRDFLRVRVGVGKPAAGMDGADWVLSKVEAGSRRLLDAAVEDAMAAVEAIMRDGLERTMNRLNRRRKAELADED